MAVQLAFDVFNRYDCVVLDEEKNMVVLCSLMNGSDHVTQMAIEPVAFHLLVVCSNH